MYLHLKTVDGSKEIVDGFRFTGYSSSVVCQSTCTTFALISQIIKTPAIDFCNSVIKTPAINFKDKILCFCRLLKNIPLSSS